jgi:hypothetical protein
MKIEAGNIKVSEVLSVGEFVSLVNKKHSSNIGSSMIHYHLNHTDMLDYVDWCGLKMIVQNTKAEAFKPGNYGNNAKVIREAKKLIGQRAPLDNAFDLP